MTTTTGTNDTTHMWGMTTPWNNYSGGGETAPALSPTLPAGGPGTVVSPSLAPSGRGTGEIVIESLALIVIWLVAVAGNVLVCLVIHRSRRLQSTTNYFVVSLAVADLVLALLCIPFILAAVIGDHWPAGQFTCKLVRFVQYMVPGTTLYVFVSICVDRFYTILYPLSFKVTRTRAKQMIFGSWLFAIVLACPCFYLYGVDPASGHCLTFLGAQGWNEVFYVVLVSVVAYMAPTIMAVVGYTRISRYIWRAGVGGRTFQRTMNPVPRAKVKMVKMIMILSSMHVLLLFPFFTAQLWYCSAGTDSPHLTLYRGVVWVYFATAASKPTIYVIYNSNFRRGCREVFCMSTMKCYRGNAYTITTTSALGRKNHVGVLEGGGLGSGHIDRSRPDTPSKTFDRAAILEKSAWPLTNNMLSTYL